MKIKKTSWHFRLHSVLNPDVKYDMLRGHMSLCRYFWKTIQTLLLVAMTAILAGLTIASMVGWPIYSILGALNVINVNEDYIGPGVVFLVFDLIIALGMLNVKFKISEKFKRPKKPNDGLVYNYLKAKKEKFCPIIEVDDD